jgi:hypothetical protein
LYNSQVPALLRLILIFAFAFPAIAQTTVDSDHDGLSDELEQTLLAKFRPTFMTSASDCAIRPASFKAAVANPTPVAADGTIYGQVFPAANHRIEVHYYMLWDKDCGRISHPLDAEHVAALITDDDGAEPKALYWYTGAHERTVCDISSGTRAQAVNATSSGPTVWSASGKHALYFKKEMCAHGCGADSCEDDRELAQAGDVVNHGELKTPVNGSLFVTYPKWLLSTKMDTDFPPEVIALIDATPPEAISTLRGRSTVRGTIQGSGMVYDNISESAATGARHTEAALDTANAQTSNSLDKATKATGNALTRAWHFIFRTKQ